jgi:DNA segregation ATPase FtsK/SpoIIIE, S-DNA-T family
MTAPTVPTLDAPRPPESPPPRRFPVIATIAPLVVSIVLFAVTRSAFTLVFAALGPVVAVASSADAVLQRRRANRRESRRFTAEANRVAAAIDAAHALERQTVASAAPPSRELIEKPERIPQRWRDDPARDITVHLGVGAAPSSLGYHPGVPMSPRGAPGGEAAAEAVHATLARLQDQALTLDDAPISSIVKSGIGIAGRPRPADAAARALILQLAATLSPADWSLTIPDTTTAEWLRQLPHSATTMKSSGVRFRSRTRALSVVTARSVTALPRDLDVVLELRADGVVLHEGRIVHPGFLGVEQAKVGAAMLADLARRLAIRPAGESSVPSSVGYREARNAARAGTSASTGLAAVVGIGSDGPVAFDLAADGPHAVVGGTTGSGKSELLLSWVLGMAADRPPSAVTFLFVDFKGGASFGSLLDLPHSVGLLTDLDSEQPLRALASLAAELRHRERELGVRELRSVDQANPPPFPRLVVVVDEYAALLETFPSLHTLFTDIAARGRSLGVHLVLCTQRPTGVVRDGILANCPMRVSLRVTSAADSTAVIGTDAAAELPARPAGRALLSLGGGSPVLFQVARCDPADVARVVERWAGAPRPRAPWLPPLKRRISLGEVGAGEPDGGIAFALADLPDEQAQRPAVYRPQEQGSLLVVGAAGSGKSGALAALAAAPSVFDVQRVVSDLPRVWDALTDVVAGAARPQRVLLFDDLDAVIAGCPDGYQPALIDLAARALREGPATGSWCVITAQRIGGAMHSLAALCGSSLLLRMPSRAEHVLAGGEPSSFVPELPPGAGHWREKRIQVAIAPVAEFAAAGPRALVVDPTSARIVAVSANPERFASLLRELAPDRRIVVIGPIGLRDHADNLSISRGGLPTIVVGDPDSWQSQWSTFGSLQRDSTVLFDGVSLAEFRALTRSRDLPPPFAAGERPLWVQTPHKALDRAKLA